MEERSLTFLSRNEWLAAAQRHRERALEWTGPMRNRRARREKHPVYDFLNTYYRSSLGQLEAWHPGLGVALDDCPEAHEHFSTRQYSFHDHLCELAPALMGEKERSRLQFSLDLLKATQDRPPFFGCHGLHEWAMVYRGSLVRHRETVPLRLPQTEIDALVEERPIACSHFDAFRFFAPEAQSFNRMQPDLWSREENEQPGCLHVGMDLYKWAAKALPWISSDLLWDCFQLALKAREIDMRASPYDLSSYGYEAIPIETESGRLQYEHEQRRLCEQAAPLRARLIADLEKLLASPGNQNYTATDGSGNFGNS